MDEVDFSKILKAIEEHGDEIVGVSPFEALPFPQTLQEFITSSLISNGTLTIDQLIRLKKKNKLNKKRYGGKASYEKLPNMDRKPRI